MSDVDIKTEVKDFVFQFLDSVEQLEILLLLSSDPSKFWTAAEVYGVLRSNLNSIEKRLAILHWYKLIAKENGTYRFAPEDTSRIAVVRDLAEAYRVHRYRILEMIFSPMKKCRDFAEAFVINPAKDPKGDNNG